MSTQVFPALRRFLVHDEIEVIHHPKGYGSYQYRIRVWRGKKMSAVVLVSHVYGSVPPHWLTPSIARYVISGILRHSEEGMAYFEDEQGHIGRALSIVHFTYAGNYPRLMPYKPEATSYSWDAFQAILGEEIER